MRIILHLIKQRLQPIFIGIVLITMDKQGTFLQAMCGKQSVILLLHLIRFMPTIQLLVAVVLVFFIHTKRNGVMYMVVTTEKPST